MVTHGFRPLRRSSVLAIAGLLVLPMGLTRPLRAQAAGAKRAAQNLSPVQRAASGRPWEFGPFVNGGRSADSGTSANFFSLGFHAGKVLTPPAGPGWLRGQFEYAAELMPLWQARTPKYQRATCYETGEGDRECTALYPTGGLYNGVSVTPILLRWNLTGGHRWMPWLQGGGGMIWTNHKFPPLSAQYPAPGHQGTSVFNFTPQFGVGVHYFVRPRQSITFAANAVHISSASLGDANPGVNASVQFSIGYSWWK